MLPLGSVPLPSPTAGSNNANSALPPRSQSQPQSTALTTTRRSFIQAVPAALASLTGYKRASQKTEHTISSTAGSERGFYRVSGRKLPSVLQSGGDGFDYNSAIHNEKHDPNANSSQERDADRDVNRDTQSSFYHDRDSDMFYGAPGSPMFRDRDSGVPVIRPSPARTPVTEHGPFFPMPPRTPTGTSPGVGMVGRRPDTLRTQPSQDGSHTSRFTEEV